MRRAPAPLSFFLHKEWNVDARAEAEQPFCTRRWSHTPGTGTGTAEQGDLQSLRHRTPWAAWTCRSSSTEAPVAAAAPTSPPATLSPPASKDGLSFIPNVQHHSDRLICPWALSGLTGGHWWHRDPSWPGGDSSKLPATLWGSRQRHTQPAPLRLPQWSVCPGAWHRGPHEGCLSSL